MLGYGVQGMLIQLPDTLLFVSYHSKSFIHSKSWNDFQIHDHSIIPNHIIPVCIKSKEHHYSENKDIIPGIQKTYLKEIKMPLNGRDFEHRQGWLLSCLVIQIFQKVKDDKENKEVQQTRTIKKPKSTEKKQQVKWCYTPLDNDQNCRNKYRHNNLTPFSWFFTEFLMQATTKGLPCV